MLTIYRIHSSDYTYMREIVKEKSYYNYNQIYQKIELIALRLYLLLYINK